MSGSEPQLGMMIQQFRRGIDGPGLGFVGEGVKSDQFYGKIGEYSGLKPSDKQNSSTTPN